MKIKGYENFNYHYVFCGETSGPLQNYVIRNAKVNQRGLQIWTGCLWRYSSAHYFCHFEGLKDLYIGADGFLLVQEVL